VRGGEREVDVARLADRLAAVERLEHGELARPLLQRACDAVHDLRPLASRRLLPAVRRVVGGAHGRVDVVGARLGDLGQHLLGGRVHRLEPAVRLRFDERAADEEPVLRPDVDDGGGLARRRVLESGHQSTLACSGRS
jgi:hypothetical protein